jgi:hypothetical protein
MSAPLLPSPLDCIGRRRFAFYPPIAHPDPNEWILGAGSRSEVQVLNAYTGHEIWISLQYIGAVSETNGSLLVVGLTKALKFREGTVEPKIKRVIEMPSHRDLVSEAGRPHSHPAPVVGIRLESRSESALTRAMVFTCIGAVVIAMLTVLLAAATKF